MKPHGVPRWAMALALAAGVAFLPGCITLAAVTAIHYVASKTSGSGSGGGSSTSGHSYAATVEVNAPAQRVYDTAIQVVQEHPLEIVSQDDDERSFEVSDGTQTARVVVLSLGREMTELTVTASTPEGASVEEHQELALSIARKVCGRMDVKCRIYRG